MAAQLKCMWVPLRGNAYFKPGNQTWKSQVMVRHQALERMPGAIACPRSCFPTIDEVRQEAQNWYLFFYRSGEMCKVNMLGFQIWFCF